jgi:tRNA dimethylallyltransferase
MARIPHRLFGTLDGADACSAARWAALAEAELESCWARGGVPILVGGTGLYIRTLLDGIAPVPEIDPDIRAEVRALAVEDAYSALADEDPGAAARLNANDRTRIARALEVVRSTLRPLSSWQAGLSGGIRDRVRLAPLILLPPRDLLYAQCEARFAEMIEQGAADEVEALLSRGLNQALPVMRAIGVSEISAWLNGAISRSEMVERATAATRQYAKRQYTWFKHQPPHAWTREPNPLNSTTREEIVIKLQDQLLTH